MTGNDSADWHRLVEASAAGRKDAIDDLVQRFYPRVQKIVHQKLEQDFRRRHRWILPLFSTRDVVQEVFGSVVAELEDCDFPDEDAFVAYLSTMVRNRLLDAVRYHEAQKRDSRRNVDAPETGVDAVARPDQRAGTPQLAAQLAEQAGIVHEVLESFQPRHQALLKLRLLEDESYPSIAAKLGYASAETARQAFLDAQARLLVKLRTRGVRAPGPGDTA